MKNVIIGTAGHIDHGKTTLIKALTGRETDRLKEEKERGITIDLGFTFFDLPSGRRAGIIDVPGHERFIKNMLAGVSGVDFTLLVISADEGIMPQTEEHLNILNLLDVKKGLIVLTKKDLVDQEWLEYVKEEVASYVKSTFLENAPIVPVSSTTGEGISELVGLIDKLTQEIEERDQDSLFRVPIDRVFSVQGFGTVVTGTLLSGSIKEGDRAMTFPKKIETRIRSIQVHDKPVKEAYAGQRVALNIAAVKKDEVQRGDVLSTIDSMEPTMMLDIKLNLLSKCPRELKNRDRLRLYHGTSEILCRIRFFDREELKPGETCYCQLRLEEPIVARRGDNYVLRFYSPMITVGGGTIVDAAPPKRKSAKEDIIEQLKLKETGNQLEVIENILLSNKANYLTYKDLTKLTGNSLDTIKDIVKSLRDFEKIAIITTGEEEYVVHVKEIKRLETEIVEMLKLHYQRYPLRSGVAKEEIKSKIFSKVKSKLSDKLVEVVQQLGSIQLSNNLIISNQLKVDIPKQMLDLVERIEKTYLDFGLAPLKLGEVSQQLNKDEALIKEVVAYLVDNNRLVKLDEDNLIHTLRLQDGIEAVTDIIKGEGSVTVAQFRDKVNISRKQALVILEYLDSKKITRRIEDKRVLI